MAADNAPHPTVGTEQAITERHAEQALAHDLEPHAGDHEKPEDWGWHHEFTHGRQIGGWLSFLVLLALLTTTHYNHAGSFAIIMIMVILAGGLIWDRQRRRHQWRQ